MLAQLNPTVAVLEKVGGRPRQKGGHTFGFADGALETAFRAAGIPTQRVTPQRWKAHFGLIGKTKDDSRALATLHFPAASASFERVKDDGRAESALLALYARAVR